LTATDPLVAKSQIPISTEFTMSLRAIALAVVLTAFGSGNALAGEPLSIAQIEKVTGMSGLVAKPAKYDKSAKDYVNAKNEFAVSVKIAGAAVYDIWKNQASMSDQEALPGIGDDAIFSKKGRYVCFKKSSTGVCVTGMVSLKGSPALVSDVQLLELAKLAAANL
jgi:hypothetical protein